MIDPIEPLPHMLCPYCKTPDGGIHVYEMITEYDGDVSKWQCEECNFVFTEQDALWKEVECPVCYDTGWVEPHDCGCAFESHCKCSEGYECPDCDGEKE